jgi:hypothetical protein
MGFFSFLFILLSPSFSVSQRSTVKHPSSSTLQHRPAPSFGATNLGMGDIRAPDKSTRSSPLQFRRQVRPSVTGWKIGLAFHAHAPPFTFGCCEGLNAVDGRRPLPLLLALLPLPLSTLMPRASIGQCWYIPVPCGLRVGLSSRPPPRSTAFKQKENLCGEPNRTRP